MSICVKYCTGPMVALTLAACSGDGDTIVDRMPVDYTGAWFGDCELADTSLVPSLDSAYYYDQLNITQNRITTNTIVFSDSDCVTPMDIPFVRNTLFDEGDYRLIEAFTTASGLAAWSFEIQAAGSEDIIANIIAISNDTLYFGYSLFDGPVNNGQMSLQALDLDNGYRRK